MKSASRFSLHLAFAGAMVLLSPLAAFSANSHFKFAGSYESDPPAPGKPDKPTPSMSLSLGTDGTATVTQDPGQGSFTTFGHFTETGNQVTVVFDPVQGQPTPAPMVFQPGHGGMEAVTWDHAAWGKVTPPPMKKAGNWHSGDHRRIF